MLTIKVQWYLYFSSLKNNNTFLIQAGKVQNVTETASFLCANASQLSAQIQKLSLVPLDEEEKTPTKKEQSDEAQTFSSQQSVFREAQVCFSLSLRVFTFVYQPMAAI